MLMIDQQQIITLLNSYAYEPHLVYMFVIGLLTASSFGLPIPEEITLITAGTLAYFGLNPQLYPPPNEGAQAVDPITLAIVCFFAVFLSDFLVYWIGRLGRNQINQRPYFQKLSNSKPFQRATILIEKYGVWMAGVFRFTPGIRFPGHMSCGLFGLHPVKFTIMDGTAALLTVPTQVLLIAYYGETILESIKTFKITLLCLIVLIVGIILFRKFHRESSKN